MFGTTQHASRQYDQDLEDIRSNVLRMGGMVEKQVRDAMLGIDTREDSIFERVIRADQEVNTMEITMDAACVEVIARRQPAANDLRMILAVSKTITDLERIGDEASKIARCGRDITARSISVIPVLADLRLISERAVYMLQGALDAFARLDAQAAALVIAQDDEIDARFRAIQRQLITHMMEDTRLIGTALDVTFIAKSIERIGDHAKNIAEYVIYMVKGLDIRHSNRETVEQSLNT
jgi:phosphate transport system protein